MTHKSLTFSQQIVATQLERQNQYHATTPDHVSKMLEGFLHLENFYN
jgi:hypothetical protein